MAASDPTSPPSEPSEGDLRPLSAIALRLRLDEEIGRAERHGTSLSCLLVVIDGLDEMAREHGAELPEQTLMYVAGAVEGELRRFDRIGRPSPGELLVVLPGADGERGEMVARRVLERMRTIKLEAHGSRRPLVVSLGLAPWEEGMATDDLLGRSRSAARLPGGELAGAPSLAERSPALDTAEDDAAAPGKSREEPPWTMGRAPGS